MDSDERFGIAIMTIVCLTIVAITGLLIWHGADIGTATDATDEQMAQDVPAQVGHANGCPLDAVAYDAPKFTGRVTPAYKVTDRLSGQSWWVVDMGSQWVVLPIEDEEAGDVG